MKTRDDITAKQRLLSGTVLPIMLGVAVGGMALATGSNAPARADGPGAVANYRSVVAGNPTALPRAAKPGARRTPTQLAGACGAKKKGCGACGAKKCGACGACGAKKGACGACGASNPCNPCGAGGGGGASTACVVPRLAKANPCGAKKCGACGAKKGGACGACGAKKAKASACGAKKAACGACGAKKNPCGAANPCNPCGAGGGAVELTDKEAHAAYDCLLKELKTAYAKAGIKQVKGYSKWRRFNTVSYQSATHGSRYVNNYANRIARKRYAKFEKAGRLPKGSVLAKDSFAVKASGQLVPGPLFSMEKMRRGWNKASRDWRYTMIMPNGSVFGITKGAGSAKMKFCYECHNSMGAETDAMTFMPKEYRKK